MPPISPRAIIACPANLAEDVVVGAFSYIGPDVHIASGVHVDNNVTLDGHVEIGADCHIYPYAAIGHADDNGAGWVRMGARNNIREHSVIFAGDPSTDRGTQIGSDNLLMTGCSIGADVVIGDHIVLGNYSQLAERTRLQTHVWAAAFTVTEADVTVGQFSFTSGYTGIDRDAPPFAVLHGFPFRVRGVNALGLRRCGFTEQQVGSLKELFRTLFDRSEQPTEETVAKLAARDDLGEHERYLVDFLQAHPAAASKEGV